MEASVTKSDLVRWWRSLWNEMCM